MIAVELGASAATEVALVLLANLALLASAPRPTSPTGTSGERTTSG